MYVAALLMSAVQKQQQQGTQKHVHQQAALIYNRNMSFHCIPKIINATTTTAAATTTEARSFLYCMQDKHN